MSREKKGMICSLLALILIILLGTSSFTTTTASASTSETGGAPGALTLTKEAKHESMRCREYDITLSIGGNPIPGNVNAKAVVVFDNSDSMRNIANSSENIAGHLMDLICDIGENQVGLVSFGKEVIKHKVGGNYFSSKSQDWHPTINQLTQDNDGASNIAEGIGAAREIFESLPEGSKKGINQVIIVLSDGIASTTLSDDGSDRYNEKAGSDAIQAAKDAAKAGIKIISISLGATETNAMKEIGINGRINIPSLSGDPKMDERNTQIIHSALSEAIFPAATDGVVTDTIATEFEFVSFGEYQGQEPALKTDTDGKQTITWNIGDINQDEKGLTYRIRAKEHYPDGTVIQGVVPTSESAHLTYTPGPGASQTGKEDFPITEVNVVSPLSVTLTDAEIVKGDSINLEDYMTVTGGWFTDEKPQVLTFTWYLADDTNMSEEITSPVTPVENTQYRVIVTDADNCIATATMWVNVKEEPNNDNEPGSGGDNGNNPPDNGGDNGGNPPGNDGGNGNNPPDNGGGNGDNPPDNGGNNPDDTTPPGSETTNPPVVNPDNNTPAPSNQETTYLPKTGSGIPTYSYTMLGILMIAFGTYRLLRFRKQRN